MFTDAQIDEALKVWERTFQNRELLWWFMPAEELWSKTTPDERAMLVEWREGVLKEQRANMRQRLEAAVEAGIVAANPQSTLAPDGAEYQRLLQGLVEALGGVQVFAPHLSHFSDATEVKIAALDYIRNLRHPPA